MPGTLFGFAARYSCSVGYKLVGLPTRVCQDNGRWSGIAPVCQRKSMQCTVYSYDIIFLFFSNYMPKTFESHQRQCKIVRNTTRVQGNLLLQQRFYSCGVQYKRVSRQ